MVSLLALIDAGDGDASPVAKARDFIDCHSQRGIAVFSHHSHPRPNIFNLINLHHWHNFESKANVCMPLMDKRIIETNYSSSMDVHDRNSSQRALECKDHYRDGEELIEARSFLSVQHGHLMSFIDIVRTQLKSQLTTTQTCCKLPSYGLHGLEGLSVHLTTVCNRRILVMSNAAIKPDWNALDKQKKELPSHVI